MTMGGQGRRETPVGSKTCERETICVPLGSLLWVKIDDDIWWPAQVVEEDCSKKTNNERFEGAILVRIYGSYQHLYIDPRMDLSEFNNILEKNAGNLGVTFQHFLSLDLKHVKVTPSKSKGKGRCITAKGAKRKQRTSTDEIKPTNRKSKRRLSGATEKQKTRLNKKRKQDASGDQNMQEAPNSDKRKHEMCGDKQKSSCRTPEKETSNTKRQEAPKSGKQKQDMSNDKETETPISKKQEDTSSNKKQVHSGKYRHAGSTGQKSKNPLRDSCSDVPSSDKKHRTYVRRKESNSNSHDKKYRTSTKRRQMQNMSNDKKLGRRAQRSEETNRKTRKEVINTSRKRKQGDLHNGKRKVSPDHKPQQETFSCKKQMQEEPGSVNPKQYASNDRKKLEIHSITQKKQWVSWDKEHEVSTCRKQEEELSTDNALAELDTVQELNPGDAWVRDILEGRVSVSEPEQKKGGRLTM